MPLPSPLGPARASRDRCRPRPAGTGLSLLAALVAGLAAAAGCAQPAGRAPALAALVRWEDRRAADPDSLAKFLASPDAAVRLATLRAAGRIGRQEAAAGLIVALRDRSPGVRVEAATALGFLGGPQGLAPLARLVDARDRELRLAAIEALGRLPQGGPSLLIPARRANLREAAAAWTGLRERAGELDPDTLRVALLDGLTREESAVLWRVLRCAEKARPDTTLGKLLARHARARDPQVRVHALRALGAQGLPAALQGILDSGDQRLAATGYDRARVRVAQLRALGRGGHAVLTAGGPAAAGPRWARLATQLADGAHDRVPAVARTAFEAMAALVEDLAPPTADGQSPDWRLRLAREAQARQNDVDAPVRAAALAALGALRGTAAAADLAAVLTAGTAVPPQVAAGAAQGLGRGGDPAALAPLAAATAPGRPPAVREAALEAIGQLWRRQVAGLPPPAAAELRRGALRTLTAAARDEDFAVAAVAAEQLGQVPSPESVLAICRLLETLPPAREGADEIRLGGFAGLEAAGHAGALRPGLAGAPVPTLAGAVPLPDSLRTVVAATLASGLDAADPRVRAQARAAVAASGLPDAPPLPPAGAPAVSPPRPRDPRQPAPVGPFAAPRLRGRTPRGDFVIALDGRIAPNTANALARLARDGYYRDQVFHRVVPDFVVQGGDPRGDGWGGPGWTLRAERSRVPYERGTVGIADSGLDTGGSQFFVCLSPQPHLTGRYTVVGRVVSGMRVLDAIEPGDRFTLEVLP